MFSAFSLSSSSFSPHKALRASSFLSQIPLNAAPRTGFVRILSTCCSSTDTQSIADDQPLVKPRSNFSGMKFNETADLKSGKARLDAWIASRIDGVSRARVESSIKSGLVTVNGRVVIKVVDVLAMNLC